MNGLIYALFASIFVGEYLAWAFGGQIGRYLTLLPELLSALAFVLVLFHLALQRTTYLPLKYGVFLSVFLLHLMVGVVANAMDPGAVFAGIRNYLKYLPFFLLPLVYAFSEKQVRGQLRLLLILSLAQFPVAVYQAYSSWGKGLMTGDLVKGTLNTSSTLSIFLVCVIAVLTAFVIKKRIRWPMFAATLVMLFIPTTLNETKGTLVLLPIAMVFPALFFSGEGAAKKRLIAMGLVGALLVGVFIPIYDALMKPRWGYGIVDFFMMENRVTGYLAPQTSGIAEHRVGRIDGVANAVRILSDDPLKVTFGVGMGNVSESFLPGFEGEYAAYQDMIGGGSLGPLVWEIGVLGTGLFVLLYLLVFRDAWRVSQRDGLAGAFALGWIAVVTILLISLIYNYYTVRNVFYLFWYFSGFVAAAACRLAREERAAERAKRPPILTRQATKLHNKPKHS